MSVIVTVTVRGDAATLEAYAAANSDALKAVVDRAVQHGLIAHRFYGADDGRIMVIDEWPDAESFQAFFSEAAPQIQPIMEGAGATSEPEVTFWRKLDTGDEYGWD
jgi:quinol monooxygenase YgiN